MRAVRGQTEATRKELKVKDDLIAKVMALVKTTRNDVLHRPTTPKP
jgi:hypothetical protein